MAPSATLGHGLVRRSEEAPGPWEDGVCRSDPQGGEDEEGSGRSEELRRELQVDV